MSNNTVISGGGELESNPYNIKPEVEKLEEMKADKSPFVYKNQVLIQTIKSAGIYNADLSEYLPQDGGIYEVWIASNITSKNKTILLFKTDIMTDEWTIGQVTDIASQPMSVNTFSCFVKNNLTCRMTVDVTYGATVIALGYRKVK